MAWSNVVEGLLVTGDNAGKIHLWVLYRHIVSRSHSFSSGT